MAQSTESQMNMYGCIIAEEKAHIMGTLSYQIGGATMPLSSLLSDSQFHMERGDTEYARKIINVVKYLLNDKEFMSKTVEEI